MKRRTFIAGLGGAAAWPLVGQAQKPMPVIGVLGPQSREAAARNVAGFHRGLNESGYVEGKNVAIEYRWAEGQNTRLPALAADLVQHPVAVIVTAGGTPPVVAAKAATSVIPIVFQIGTDPVAFGFVASLNRPGANLTGVTSLFDEVGAKRLELLEEAIPSTAIFALLVNPANPNSETQSRDLRRAASEHGLELHIFQASAEHDLDEIFPIVAKLEARGLVIGGDPFLGSHWRQMATLALRYEIPTIAFERGFPEAGGLMSYGANLAASYRLAGIVTAQILDGATPAHLPVQRSTKVELVINLNTARKLDLNISPTFLARADEVIE